MFHADFKVPDYYRDFACKGASCRRCCCQGWKVTLTRDEYFKLLNRDCSKELREKIDAYVGILPHPTVEEYARINFGYNGQCPLRLKNGFCGLQVECGEDSIASVCRYYPRSPRLVPEPECCISNSCEWVLERLIHMDGDLSFSILPLSFSFEDDEDSQVSGEAYSKLREKSFGLLTGNRPFEEKLSMLVGKNDFISSENDSYIIQNLMGVFSRSVSIGFYLDHVPKNRLPFDEMYRKLKEIYPDLDSYFTKILENHFFYMKYPFLFKGLDVSYAGLCLYYGIYFWMCVLYYNLSSKDIDDFVDIGSSFFRVLEHSNVYQVIYSLILRK